MMKSTNWNAQKKSMLNPYEFGMNNELRQIIFIFQSSLSQVF